MIKLTRGKEVVGRWSLPVLLALALLLSARAPVAHADGSGVADNWQCGVPVFGCVHIIASTVDLTWSGVGYPQQNVPELGANFNVSMVLHIEGQDLPIQTPCWTRMRIYPDGYIYRYGSCD